MIGQGGVSSVAGGAQGNYPQYHGIFYGAVSNNADPKKQNRCTLRVPQILGSGVTTWALPLTPMVDPPKVGTLVAVLFTGGDLDNPVYLVVNPAVPIEGTNANIQPVGTTAAAGTSHKVAAADHVHTLANALESLAANIQALGTQAAGASPKAARADHVHSMGSVAEIDGAGGELVLTSGSTGAGQALIQILSSALAGQTDIELDAVNVNASNNFSCNNIVVNNAPSNTTSSIAGGNTVGTSGGSYNSTWCNDVRDTIATMYGAINAMFTSFNNMYNNVYS